MAILISNTGLGGRLKVSGNSTGGFKAMYVPPPLLLDTYSGAAAAYSLRKLRTAYSGVAIRVRRSSDNIETDIGFNVSGELNTTVLSTFVGANDGFISKWYDQSGNARDLIQNTLTNQPKIIISGALQTQNSKPAIKFQSANSNMLQSLANNFGGPLSVFTAFSYTSASQSDARIFTLPSSGGSYDSVTYVPIFRIGTNNQLGSFVANIGSNGITANYNTLLSFTNIATGTNINNYLNGVASTSLSQNFNINSSQFRMGSSDYLGGTSYYDGLATEFVAFLSNQTSNRAAIESNINSYYSIY